MKISKSKHFTFGFFLVSKPILWEWNFGNEFIKLDVVVHDESYHTDFVKSASIEK